jgi:hypothetical protein
MSQRFDSLTRSQLIGGMLATGALAACGGRVNPAPANVSNYAGTASGLGFHNGLSDKILSHQIFDGVDKEGLKRRFDPSSRLAAIQRTYFEQIGQTPQTDKTITHIPAKGVVIKKPGKYSLGRNIDWTPGKTASSAITITASNVTLDFAGFTLTASVSDKSRQTAGVTVSGPLANVTIQNGTIANVTEYGILAKNVVGLNISSVTVTGLCMNNLEVRNSTPTGFEVSLSDAIVITGCRVEQTNVTTDSCAGIQFVGTSQALVTKCHVSDFVNNDGSVQGYSYIGCSAVTTAGCTATSFQSHFNGNTKTTGHTVIGYCPIFCENLEYRNCSSSNFIGCCDDCHGFSVFLDNDVTVSGFRAQHIVDGVSPSHSGAKATGLEVYGNNVTIADCSVSAIKAINPQDKQAAGFSAWGSVIKFNRCKARNVTVREDLVADAMAVGFGWAPDPRPQFCHIGAYGATYLDCAAENCEVGFDTWFHVNSTWVCPKTTNCKTAILVQPGAKRTISCDPCSECDPQFDVTLTNIASGNTIKHCK